VPPAAAGNAVPPFSATWLWPANIKEKFYSCVFSFFRLFSYLMFYYADNVRDFSLKANKKSHNLTFVFKINQASWYRKRPVLQTIKPKLNQIN
jgi:hypothetical protein